jgi:hypothetical protein
MNSKKKGIFEGKSEELNKVERGIVGAVKASPAFR